MQRLLRFDPQLAAAFLVVLASAGLALFGQINDLHDSAEQLLKPLQLATAIWIEHREKLLQPLTTISVILFNPQIGRFTKAMFILAWVTVVAATFS